MDWLTGTPCLKRVRVLLLLVRRSHKILCRSHISIVGLVDSGDAGDSLVEMSRTMHGQGNE